MQKRLSSSSATLPERIVSVNIRIAVRGLLSSWEMKLTKSDFSRAVRISRSTERRVKSTPTSNVTTKTMTAQVKVASVKTLNPRKALGNEPSGGMYSIARLSRGGGRGRVSRL